MNMQHEWAVDIEKDYVCDIIAETKKKILGGSSGSTWDFWILAFIHKIWIICLH